MRNRRLFAKILGVAVAVDDNDLAAGLLAPFHLHHLGARAMSPLLALLKSYGDRWCRDQFSQWGQNMSRYGNAGDNESQWLGFMPTCCQRLCQGGGEPGVRVAQWIVEHQWSNLKQQCEVHLEDRASPHMQALLTKTAKKLISVLESCIAAGHRVIHDRIVAFMIDSDTDYPLRCLVDAMRDAYKVRNSTEFDALDLTALRCHCIAELRTHLAEQPRSRDDWSIEALQKCTCDLCQELAKFLGDRDQERLEWPLAKQKRLHVHRQLDDYDMPVTHETRRQGRPFTLVLQKTKALFARDAELRKLRKQQLKWLSQQS